MSSDEDFIPHKLGADLPHWSEELRAGKQASAEPRLTWEKLREATEACKHLVAYPDERYFTAILTHIFGAVPAPPPALTNSNQRMWDLVRYMRHELHEGGLITDEEFAELVKDSGSVKRLEDYRPETPDA